MSALEPFAYIETALQELAGEIEHAKQVMIDACHEGDQAQLARYAGMKYYWQSFYDSLSEDISPYIDHYERCSDPCRQIFREALDLTRNKHLDRPKEGDETETVLAKVDWDHIEIQQGFSKGLEEAEKQAQGYYAPEFVAELQYGPDNDTAFVPDSADKEGHNDIAENDMGRENDAFWRNIHRARLIVAQIESETEIGLSRTFKGELNDVETARNVAFYKFVLSVNGNLDDDAKLEELADEIRPLQDETEPEFGQGRWLSEQWSATDMTDGWPQSQQSDYTRVMAQFLDVIYRKSHTDEMINSALTDAQRYLRHSLPCNDTIRHEIMSGFSLGYENMQKALREDVVYNPGTAAGFHSDHITVQQKGPQRQLH